MNKFCSFIIFIVLFAACKDAPILVKAGLHDDGKKKTLFTIETVYTVTSKKSGGGMTTRSGYTTCYLNAIDVKTGETLNRKKIGDFSDRIEFLGSLGNKAWFYSYDPKIGLHTRNPETLEIVESVKDIIGKNSALSSGITEQGYQTNIDSSGKFIFTTTKDGYNYLIDPVTLLATKTTDRTNRRYYFSGDNITATGRIEINDSMEFGFSGTPRSALEVKTKQFNKKSYDFYSQNGVDMHSKNLYYNSRPDQKYPEINFIDPKLLVDITSACGDDNRNPVLFEGNHYFLISKSMLGDDFNWIISAIDVNYNAAKLAWSTTIDKTEKLSSSDKNLLSTSIAGDEMLLVFENMMLALNRNTGALIWRKDIRTESD
ncbi:MAG: PA2928 family protein [Ferruginibacter sp.]